jgi:hypothetical protein
MRYHIIFFSILLMACCTSCNNHPEGWVTSSSEIEGDWVCPGDSTISLRMIISSGGLLTFSGGFEYFNPASWEYNPSTKLLKIKVKTVMEKGLESMKKHLELQNLNRKTYKNSGQSLIMEVSPLAGEVIYRLGDAMSLNWLGWVFHKQKNNDK